MEAGNKGAKEGGGNQYIDKDKEIDFDFFFHVK